MAKGKWLKAKGKIQNLQNRKKITIGFSSIAFCLLPFALCLLSSGCKAKVAPGTVAVKRPQVEGVTIATALPSEVEEYFEASGTIKAKTISRIASKVMGTVTSLRVKEGDRVRAGQVLMTIDDRDMAQKVTAAEKTLDVALQNKSLADITYRRYKNLYDEKALSQQEIDQIETQKKVAELDYERAKALLAEARINRGFATIISPVSGVVTDKKIEPGSMVVPGVTLMTVEDTSSFIIEANLDEHLTRKVAIGTPVAIALDALGLKTQGRVTEIGPSIDPMSRTFLAKISVSGPSLSTGLYARIKIPSGTKQAIVVPDKAIVEKGQLTGVYVVAQDGTITYRLVRLGERHGDAVEVVSGLSPNEQFVADNTLRAVDGGIIAGVKTR